MHQRRVLQKLTAIQRRAGAIIAGAFRTTAGPALEVELYLLPMKQQMEKALGYSLLRLTTTSTYDIIRKPRATWNRQLRQRSSLERLQIRYQEQLRLPQGVKLEHKSPYIVPSWWDPPATHIADNAEKAVRTHDINALCRDRGTLEIYMDGSAIGGHVGAAAVASGIAQAQKCYMGTDETFTVYAAELQGLVMATSLARRARHNDPDIWAVNIYSDNQAGIQAAEKPETQSGQYLLRDLVKGLDDLREKNIRVQIHWIPAHIGVPGNEEADRAAKEAAQSPRMMIRPIYHLTVTCKQLFKKRVMKEWANEWENGTTGRVTFSLEKEPTRKVLDKHTGVRRPISSLITQLRTGKIGLAHYLHRIGRHNSPRCPCDQGIQTVRHVLVECSRTQDLRDELLGRTNDIKKILGNSALVKSAAILILRANLLRQFQAVTEVSEDLQTT